jgi:two-component system, NarL family, sensor kinase
MNIDYQSMRLIRFSRTLACLFMFLLNFITQVDAQGIDSISKLVDGVLGSKSKIKIQSSIYQKDTLAISGYLRKALEYQSDNYDSLKLYTDKALSGALKTGDLDKISQSIEMLGRYYIFQENYATAGACFLKCLSIEEKRNIPTRIADINDELGIIYYYQEVFGKSLQYSNRALEIYRKQHDTLNIAKSYSHLGSLYSSREFCETRSKDQKAIDFKTALEYHEKAVQLCVKTGNKPLMINEFVNIASVYNKLDQPSKALPYLKQALEYHRKAGNLNRIVGALQTMGRTYLKLKRNDLSIQCYQEALSISLKNNFLDGIQYLYEAMAQTYDAAKDYKNAYNYYIKYMTIRDSLNNAIKAKSLFELETKFQSEKKEKEIVKLRAEKREKNILIFALSGLMAIVIILGLFIFKNIRNKRIISEQTIRIREQQILEMEKERQLIATKSVLQGEEAERTRMARDLHDGLGGMLSSVKINLSSMKGNSIITDENAEAFNHAIGLLDHSITELRRVAHNMMPETLVHYGLKVAFEDFVSRISTENTPQIDFQFFGQEGRYSSELEITGYRIGQELVNNALKHSGAGTINLQLISETNRLCIQVMDNGKGFDTSVPTGGGKGLVSIRDRVTAMNGTFEIWSKPGEGTETTAEFLVS